MAKNYQDYKIAYMHGRLGPHIMHGRLADSVGAEYHIIDQYKKWNEGKQNRLYLLYAWIINALKFKDFKKYAIYLVSGPHFSPIIMKRLKLRKEQKTICHLGDETMYFLYAKWYSKIMQKALVKLLNNYDALFCEGAMAAELAQLNGIDKPKIYTTYLGVPKERQIKFLELTPSYDKNSFLFIASGPSGWRTYYKGLDLMINAFQAAFEERNDLEFIIVGEWDKELQANLLKNCSSACKEVIKFVGSTNSLEEYLERCCFYFHTSRGDAFPTVVLEAMSSGLIPLVSNWTGSKEVVAKVYSEGIVEIDESKIKNQLLWMCNLSNKERLDLSTKSREVSKSYTQEFALKHYQNTMNQFIIDSNL